MKLVRLIALLFCFANMENVMKEAFEINNLFKKTDKIH